MPTDGTLYHYGVVRLRVKGSGDLDLKLLSLDGVREKELKALPMQAKTPNDLFRPTNFKENRAQLEFSVDEIDEYFEISTIVIFVKPYATGRPG